MTLWVIFDGYGEQVFCTYEENLANYSTMNPEHYNLDKCSIEIVNDYDPSSGMECVKNMITGEITQVKRPRGFQRTFPHVPCP